MKKLKYPFSLQRFDAVTPIQGKQIITKVRLLENNTSAATIIALATESSRTASKDADTTTTKDGAFRTPKALEQELKVTSKLPAGDTIIDQLEGALKADKIVEVWEINKAEKGTSGGDSSKYKSMYYQTYVTSFEKTASAEDLVEISLTFAVIGEGASGYATLTEAEAAAASYSFQDTTAKS